MSIQQPGQPTQPVDPQGFGPVQGQGYPPMPPKKKSRLPLILGVVGIFLVLCVGIAVVAALAGGGDSSATTGAAVNTPAATSVPAAGATVAATSAPAGAGSSAAPSGKWSEPAKGKVTFGTEFRSAKSGGFEVLDARSAFKPGTELRIVAQFKEKAGATEIEIIVSKIVSGGAESVVDKAKLDLSSPDSNYYSTTLGTDGVGIGDYKVKFVRGGTTILAEGQFSLSATAASVR